MGKEEGVVVSGVWEEAERGEIEDSGGVSGGVWKGAREGEDAARTRTEEGSGGVNASPSSRIFSQ